MVRADVMPPWLDAACESFDHPHASFRRGLTGDTKRTAPGLVHRHAFRREFVPTENAVDQLSGVGVFFEAGGTARLMIEKYHFRALEDRFRVTKRPALRGDRPAVHSEPKTIRPAGRFRRAIVEIP